LQNGDEVLLIFQAEQGYLSPSALPSKLQHHQQVPTWNYRVVHVKGRACLHDNARFVRRQLIDLTARYERSQAKPWSMSDSPRQFIDQMVQGCIGIEIVVSSWLGKDKLSQNKSIEDRLGAISALHAHGNGPLAEAMQRNIMNNKNG
ncbi:MAG: FMN-binding negative transcriptional regulator, partial [Shewanella sp.]